MKQLKSFDLCGNHITMDAQSSTISRVNPHALPCASCGSTERKLGAGRQPGEASLLCECGKFVRWLRGSQLTQFTKGGQR
jgi:hypothetical protein